MKTVKLLFEVLPPEDRRKLIILFAAVVLMGLVEVVGLATLGPFFTALTEPQELLKSGFTADLADRLGLTTQRQLVLTFGLLALGAIGFRSALSGITMYKLLRWAYSQTHSLAQQLLHAYAFQPYHTFTEQNAGDLAKNVLMEVQSVINGVVVPAISLYAYSIVGVFVIAFLALIDPPLALLLGGSMALFYAPIVLAARRRMAKIGLERLDSNQQRSRSATELLAGIKEIKAAGAEGVFLERFNKPSERFSRLTAISQIVAQSPRYAFELVVIASLILVAIYLSSGNQQRLLPTLALFAFGAYRLMPILQQAFAALTNVRFNSAALELLHKDLSSLEVSDVALNRDTPKRLDMRERLSIRDVSLSFRERDRAALRRISLEVSAGSVVGIVGATGSGKSSLLDVMMGLIEPDEGEVWCDGIRLLDPVDFARFRSSIGYVSQRVFLFDASVGENVAMTPDWNGRDSDIEEACRIAQIDDFIRGELPHGYETHVGFEGSRLSGGQRQRIGIARALYREPSLLILDEGTSQLDITTEQRVFEGIRARHPHMTIIVVSHRPSTLERCDALFEMEAGRLAQIPLARLASHPATPRNRG